MEKWFVTFEQLLNDRFEEGRDKERTETIASMIMNGFDDNQIMSVFKNVSLDDIAAIRRKIMES